MFIASPSGFCFGCDDGRSLTHNLGETPTHFMRIDTPEKLAQALRIAVEKLEYIYNHDYTYHDIDSVYDDAEAALKQIEEVLK